MFAIETNQPAGLKKSGITRDLLKVAAAFGITDPVSTRRIEKLNRTSDIHIVADAEGGTWALRASAAETSSNLSLQTRIFHEIKGARVIRPRPLPTGGFVHVLGRAWICYPFVTGKEFIGGGSTPMDAIREALNVNAAIQRWGQANPGAWAELPLLATQPDRFEAAIDDLLDYKGDGMPDMPVRQEVENGRTVLQDLIRRAANIDVGPIAPTHCDLHHGNIVAGPDGPTVIDLEDICCDSLAISSAHAVFKLTRHAVHLGLLTADASVDALLRPGIEHGAMLGLLPDDAGAAMTLAAQRTIRDIINILNFARHPGTAWMTYDLAKKAENLVEISWYQRRAADAISI